VRRIRPILCQPALADPTEIRAGSCKSLAEYEGDAHGKNAQRDDDQHSSEPRIRAYIAKGQHVCAVLHRSGVAQGVSARYCAIQHRRRAGYASPWVMMTVCPLCHTPAPTITDPALKAGGVWQCTRCGHKWDVVRLVTAAAYAAYAESHP